MLKYKHAAIAMRKHHNKVERSVFREIQVAFNRLGVPSRLLRIRKSPMSITYLPTGNVIYFSGIDNIDDVKGIVDGSGRPIESVWLEELTQFKLEDVTAIRGTFVRKTKNFKVFYTYNNPSDTYHWIYEWVEKETTRDDVVYNSSTYLNVPIDFIGEGAIKEAEALRDIDEPLYRHVYLNEKIRLGGLVYKNFNEQALTHDLDNIHANASHHIIGIDIGLTDATTFTYTQLCDRFSKVRVMRHYYHKNEVTRQIRGFENLIECNGEKLINDYLEDCIVFIKHCQELIPDGKPIHIRVDTSHPDFTKNLKLLQANRRIERIQIDSINKSKKDNTTDKKSIEERIGLTTIMIGANALELNTHPSLYELKKAFSQAIRKNGHRLDNGTTNIDSLDSFEYSWYEYFKQLQSQIIRVYSQTVKPDETTKFAYNDTSDQFIINGVAI